MTTDLNSFIPERIVGAEREKMLELLADRLGNITLEIALAAATTEQKDLLMARLKETGGGEAGLRAVAEFTADIPGLMDRVEAAMSMELTLIAEKMGWNE